MQCEQFLAKLNRHTPFGEIERRALFALEGCSATFSSGQIINKPSEDDGWCTIVIEGLVARTAHTLNGNRQITTFYVPGDIADIHALVAPSNSGLQAMCQTVVLRIPRKLITDLVANHPTIGVGLCREAVAQFEICSEWLLNLGQRRSISRLAHLFCEMAQRIGVEHSNNQFRFEFPVTQGEIGGATGMSTVQVNRVMHRLRNDDVVRMTHHLVDILDWAALKKIAGFDGRYLMPADARKLGVQNEAAAITHPAWQTPMLQH